MEKKYVGTGKTVSTKFGDILKLSFSENDLKTLQENLSNGWVNVDIMKRKEPSEKGTTHYGRINTWKQQQQSDRTESFQNEKKSAPKQVIDDDGSDLPF